MEARGAAQRLRQQGLMLIQRCTHRKSPLQYLLLIGVEECGHEARGWAASDGAEGPRARQRLTRRRDASESNRYNCTSLSQLLTLAPNWLSKDRRPLQCNRRRHLK